MAADIRLMFAVVQGFKIFPSLKAFCKYRIHFVEVEYCLVLIIR